MRTFFNSYNYKTYPWIICKKTMLIAIIGALSVTMFTACQKGSNNNVNNTPETANTADNTNTADTTNTDTTENETKNSSPGSQESGETLTVKDFYPFLNNVVYRYEGEGNEYASYSIYTDYMEGNRIQLRSSNGGSESVKVLELKDGELIKTLQIGECYYRENLLNKGEDNGEVLLKEPLTKGTEWMISGNRRRYISNTDVVVSTPTGEYKALEVTTEGDGDATLDYYVRGVGLVKTIFTTNGSTNITSSLSKIEENTPFKQKVRLFYPDVDKDVIYTQNKEIIFNTNDITQNKLEAAAKEITQEKLDPLLSDNIRIKSLYLNKDNVVCVDFSKELISEMNAGPAYETMILQCIANTLGTYYGVDKVYLTVEGKPYESGHISMKKDETIGVDMGKVKE